MAMSGISMIQYFSTKIRLAKEAGFADVYQQLLAVWNGLDIEVREHIPEPDEDTSVEKFRKSLEDRERLWKEKLLRNRFRPQGPGQRYGANSGAFGNDAGRSHERPWVSPAQNPGAPRYAGDNQGWRNNNNAPGRITQPAPRLQLTAGPTPGTAVPSNNGPPGKRETKWTPGRRACAKCGGAHMDWEHEYYQNSANANRRPTKAFYLDVLQNGMGSRDAVADCISAYHAAEDDEQSSPATVVSDQPDLQAVGGSNWFSDTSYSEMEFVDQYHVAELEPTKSGRPIEDRYQLGEAERDERNGSRKVLPPRNLSEVSRQQAGCPRSRLR